jgi:ribonuclease P protein subunit POP4
MRVTPDVLGFEFIGRHAEAITNALAGNTRVSGTVIDETRNTFTLLANAERKSIIKESTIFRFELPDHAIVEINGKLLVGRPEDRLKKCVKRLW